MGISNTSPYQSSDQAPKCPGFVLRTFRTRNCCRSHNTPRETGGVLKVGSSVSGALVLAGGPNELAVFREVPGLRRHNQGNMLAVAPQVALLVKAQNELWVPTPALEQLCQLENFVPVVQTAGMGLNRVLTVMGRMPVLSQRQPVPVSGRKRQVPVLDLSLDATEGLAGCRWPR